MGQHLNLIGVNIGNFRFSTRKLASWLCLNYITGNFLCGIIITNLAAYCFIFGNWLAILVNIVGQHLDLIGVNIGDFGFGTREFTSWFCLNYVAGNFLCGIVIANLAS